MLRHNKDNLSRDFHCIKRHHVEYYDLDETYKDFVKILLTVHKRVYDMKHKMDIWFFQEEKNMKNISTKNTKVSA